MSEVVDDDTLKMLVKLTSESKLLYRDLESTPKMRRARRLLYLAQLGLMTEKTLDGEPQLGVRMPAPGLAPAVNVEVGGAANGETFKTTDEPEQVKSAPPTPLLADEPQLDRTQVNTEKPVLNEFVNPAPLEQNEPTALSGTTNETSTDRKPLNRRKPAFKSTL